MCISQLVAAKVEPSEYQKSVLEQLSAVAGDKVGVDATKKPKKRKAKGPNPLSVKKSSKMRSQGRRATASSGLSHSKVLV